MSSAAECIGRNFSLGRILHKTCPELINTSNRLVIVHHLRVQLVQLVSGGLLNTSLYVTMWVHAWVHVR